MQRSKRHWGQAERVRFVTMVEASRRDLIRLLAEAPLKSPEYRELSTLLAAVHAAGTFLNLEWTKPGNTRQTFRS